MTRLSSFDCVLLLCIFATGGRNFCVSKLFGGNSAFHVLVVLVVSNILDNLRTLSFVISPWFLTVPKMSFATNFKSAAAFLGVFPQTPSQPVTTEQSEKSGRNVGGARVAPKAERFDKADFGDLPLVNSAFKSTRVWTDVSAINASHDNKMVWVRARVHTVRSKGKMTFIVLRRGMGSIQCLVADDGTQDTVPRAMVKYAAKIYAESVIDIYGRISKVDQPTSCSQSDVEIKVGCCAVS